MFHAQHGGGTTLDGSANSSAKSNAVPKRKRKCVNASDIHHGVTFLGGFKAGAFTYQPRINNMEKCIDKCCGSFHCDAAFLLDHNCYSVHCAANKDLCRVISAKTGKYNTSVAFMNSETPQDRKFAKTSKQSDKTHSILDGQCEVSGIQRNVNLTGGWEAGKFVRYPDVHDIHRCSEICCRYHGCSSALLIGQYCYNLMCFKGDLCKQKATNGSFMIPKMVVVQRKSHHSVSVMPDFLAAALSSSKEFITPRLPKNGAPKNENLNKLATSPIHGVNFSISSARGTASRRSQSPLTKTVLPRESSTSRSALYDVRESSTKLSVKPSIFVLPTLVSSRESDVLKVSSAIRPSQLNSIFLEVKRVTPSTLVLPRGKSPVTPTVASHLSQVKNSTDIKPDILTKSSRLVVKRTGVLQGKLLPLSSRSADIQTAHQITMTANTDVTKEIRQFDETLGQIHVPAIKLTVSPTELPTRTTGSVYYSKSISNVQLKSSVPSGRVFSSSGSNSRYTSRAATTVNSTSGQEAKTVEASSALNVSRGHKRSNLCLHTFILHNVTLRDEQKAENIKTEGDVRSLEECIDMCCSDTECSAAYMSSGACSHVTCSPVHSCDAVPRYNTGGKATLAYVARSESERKRVKALIYASVAGEDVRSSTVALQVKKSLAESKLKPASLERTCIPSPTLHNVGFRLGMRAGDFKAVGVVNGTETCVRLCCNSHDCDAAFLIGSRCHLVSCFSKLSCRAVKANSRFYTPTVVYIARSKVEAGTFSKLLPEQFTQEDKTSSITFTNSTSKPDKRGDAAFKRDGVKPSIKSRVAGTAGVSPAPALAGVISKATNGVTSTNTESETSQEHLSISRQTVTAATSKEAKGNAVLKVNSSIKQHVFDVPSFKNKASVGESHQTMSRTAKLKENTRNAVIKAASSADYRSRGHSSDLQGELIRTTSSVHHSFNIYSTVVKIHPEQSTSKVPMSTATALPTTLRETTTDEQRKNNILGLSSKDVKPSFSVRRPSNSIAHTTTKTLHFSGSLIQSSSKSSLHHDYSATETPKLRLPTSSELSRSSTVHATIKTVHLSGLGARSLSKSSTMSPLSYSAKKEADSRSPNFSLEPRSSIAHNHLSDVVIHHSPKPSMFLSYSSSASQGRSVRSSDTVKPSAVSQRPSATTSPKIISYDRRNKLDRPSTLPYTDIIQTLTPSTAIQRVSDVTFQSTPMLSRSLSHAVSSKTVVAYKNQHGAKRGFISLRNTSVFHVIPSSSSRQMDSSKHLRTPHLVKAKGSEAIVETEQGKKRDSISPRSTSMFHVIPSPSSRKMDSSQHLRTPHLVKAKGSEATVESKQGEKRDSISPRSTSMFHVLPSSSRQIDKSEHSRTSHLSKAKVFASIVEGSHRKLTVMSSPNVQIAPLVSLISASIGHTEKSNRRQSVSWSITTKGSSRTSSKMSTDLSISPLISSKTSNLSTHRALHATPVKSIATEAEQNPEITGVQGLEQELQHVHWRKNQTSLQKAERLIKILQTYLNNVTTKREVVPRPKEFGHQQANMSSKDSDVTVRVSRIMTDLIKNFAEVPFMRKLNNTIHVLAKNGTKKTADFHAVKSMLNTIAALLKRSRNHEVGIHVKKSNPKVSVQTSATAAEELVGSGIPHFDQSKQSLTLKRPRLPLEPIFALDDPAANGLKKDSLSNRKEHSRANTPKVNANIASSTSSALREISFSSQESSASLTATRSVFSTIQATPLKGPNKKHGSNSAWYSHISKYLHSLFHINVVGSSSEKEDNFTEESVTPALDTIPSKIRVSPQKVVLRTLTTVNTSSATNYTSHDTKTTGELASSVFVPTMSGTPTSSKVYTSASRSSGDAATGISGYFTQLWNKFKSLLASRAVDANHKTSRKSVEVKLFKSHANMVLTSISLTPSRTLQQSTATKTTSTSWFPRRSGIHVHSSHPRGSKTAFRIAFSTAGSVNSTAGLPSKSSRIQKIDFSAGVEPLRKAVFEVAGRYKLNLCNHSPAHVNSTLRGGILAGNFTEYGVVSSDSECISQCCEAETCDLAFMLLRHCFLVKCRSKRLCESVPAKDITDAPRVIYVRKTLVSPAGFTSSRVASSSVNSQSSVQPSRSELLNQPSTASKKNYGIVPSQSKPKVIPRSFDIPVSPFCNRTTIHHRVLLRGGFKSGFFKYQGEQQDWDSCVELCCKWRFCSLAYAIENHCYSVACYSGDLCDSVPAQNTSFHLQLAYIRSSKNILYKTDKSSANTIGAETTTRDFVIKTSSRHSTPTPSPSVFSSVTRDGVPLLGRRKSCRGGKHETGMTLKGGVNAGRFLNAGLVSDVHHCVRKCCEKKDCQLVFVISNHCFLVTCYTSELCQGIPARKSGYKTTLVRINRKKVENVEDFLAKVIQPSSPDEKVKNAVSTMNHEGAATRFHHKTETVFQLPSSIISDQYDADAKRNQIMNKTRMGRHDEETEGSMNSGHPGILAPAEPVESKVVLINGDKNKHDRTWLIKVLGMSTPTNKRSRNALLSGVTPSGDTSTVSVPFQTGRTAILNEATQKTTKEECYGTRVYFNSTMRGGINAGIFKEVGRVDSMRTCVNHCCQWKFCSVAFMILTRCYIIACYDEHLCEPIPARNGNFYPKLDFVSRIRRGDEDVISNRPSIKPLPSTEQAKSLAGTKSDSNQSRPPFSENKSASGEKLLKSSLPHSEGAVGPSTKFQRNCSRGTPEFNVTLRGGLKSGNFTDQGKVRNISSCVSLCCADKHCDVALMLLDNCFLVKCRSRRLCESMPARTLTYRSRLVHVTRINATKLRRLSRWSTSTVSLLDAAMPAMAGKRNQKPSKQPEHQIRSVQPTPSTKSVHIVVSRNVISPLKESHISGKSRLKTTENNKTNSSTVSSRLSTFTPRSSRTRTKSAKHHAALADETLTHSNPKEGLRTRKKSVRPADIPPARQEKKNGSLFADTERRIKGHRNVNTSGTSSRTASSRHITLRTAHSKDGFSEILTNKSSPKMPSDSTTGTAVPNAASKHRDSEATSGASGEGLPPSQATESEAEKLSDEPSPVHNSTPFSLQQHVSNSAAHDSSSGHFSELLPGHSTRSRSRLSSCSGGPISYNVTLRHGFRSGSFRHQGRVENMSECLKLCCAADDCDVAFMLKNSCYLVRCYTEKGCEQVQARSSSYNPRLARVRRRKDSQLMSFISEQEVATNRSVNTTTAQPRRDSMEGTYVGRPTALPRPMSPKPRSLKSHRPTSATTRTTPASIIPTNASKRRDPLEYRKITTTIFPRRELKFHPTTSPLRSDDHMRRVQKPTSKERLRAATRFYTGARDEPMKTTLPVHGEKAYIQTVRENEADEIKLSVDALKNLFKQMTLSKPVSTMKPLLKQPSLVADSLSETQDRFANHGDLVSGDSSKETQSDRSVKDGPVSSGLHSIAPSTFPRFNIPKPTRPGSSIFRPETHKKPAHEGTHRHVKKTYSSRDPEANDHNNGNVVKLPDQQQILRDLGNNTQLNDMIQRFLDAHMRKPFRQNSTRAVKTSRNVHTSDQNDSHPKKHRTGSVRKRHRTRESVKVSREQHLVQESNMDKHLKDIIQRFLHAHTKKPSARNTSHIVDVHNASKKDHTKTRINKKKAASHRNISSPRDNFHPTNPKTRHAGGVHSKHNTSGLASLPGEQHLLQNTNLSTQLKDMIQRFLNAHTVKPLVPTRSQKTSSSNASNKTQATSESKVFSGDGEENTSGSGSEAAAKTSIDRKIATRFGKTPPTPRPGCTVGHVEYNQTLRGGLSSGLFHEVGHVTDIQNCSRHCCSSTICDLSFMVLSHCFLVTCSNSNPRLCESVPALATNFKPIISRVIRHQTSRTEGSSLTKPTTPGSTRRPGYVETTAKPMLHQPHTTRSQGTTPKREVSSSTLAPFHSIPPQPGCASVFVQQNTTLRGGLRAGKFMDMGVQNSTEGCARLCCNSTDCDLAFYAFHRCYLIKCYDEYLCQATPSLLPDFKPTIIQVSHRRKVSPTKPSPLSVEKVLYSIQESKESSRPVKMCPHSSLYTDVTLRKGYEAGNFTSHGKVSSPKECLSHCCKERNCDLMFMFLENCFTVSCASGYDCEIVAAKRSRFSPKIMYVVKKNTSEPPLSPSQLNTSLFSPTSVAGDRPVNVVYFKENETLHGSGSAYLPTNTPAKYGAKHAANVSIMGSDILATMHSYLKAITSSDKRKPTLKHDLKYRYLKRKLHKLLRNLKRPKHIGSGHVKKKHWTLRRYMTKEMRGMMKKLQEVTKEDRELKSEVKSLVSKKLHGTREGESEVKSLVSKKLHGTREGKSEVKSLVSKKLHRIKKGKRSRSRKVESVKAGKRVVIVDPDTDSIPIYPTNEHRMEERKIYGKSKALIHHYDLGITSSGDAKRKHRTKKVKKKVRQRHRKPQATNEHNVEEHEIPHRIHDETNQESDEHDIREHSIERPPSKSVRRVDHSKMRWIKKDSKHHSKDVSGEAYFGRSSDLSDQIASGEPEYPFGSGDLEDTPSSSAGYENRRKEENSVWRIHFQHRVAHKLNYKKRHNAHKARKIKHQKSKLDLLYDKINKIFERVEKLGNPRGNTTLPKKRIKGMSRDSQSGLHESQWKKGNASLSSSNKYKKPNVTHSHSTSSHNSSIPAQGDDGSTGNSYLKSYRSDLFDYISKIYHHVQQIHRHKMRRQRLKKKKRKKHVEFASGWGEHEGSAHAVKRARKKSRKIGKKTRKKSTEEEIILREIRKISNEIKDISSKKSENKKKTLGSGSGKNLTSASNPLHKNLTQRETEAGQRSVIPHFQKVLDSSASVSTSLSAKPPLVRQPGASDLIGRTRPPALPAVSTQLVSTRPTVPLQKNGGFNMLATKMVKNVNPTVPATKTWTTRPRTASTLQSPVKKNTNTSLPVKLAVDKLGLGKIPPEQLDISDLVEKELETTQKPPESPKLDGKDPGPVVKQVKQVKQERAGLRTLIDGVAAEVARDVLKNMRRGRKMGRDDQANQPTTAPLSPSKESSFTSTTNALDEDSGPEDAINDEMKYSVETSPSPEKMSFSFPTRASSHVRVKAGRRKHLPEVPGPQDLTFLEAFRKHWREKMAAAVHKKIDIPSSGIGNDAYLIVHLGFESIRGHDAQDDSGLHNNAKLSPGAHVTARDSKCGNAIRIRGGPILFNGHTFRSRPREAVTLALWAKVDSIAGKFSFFKTEGSGAKYNLEMRDAKIRWSHVDDLNRVVFNVETSPLVNSQDWFHIAASYDARVNKSKIILNGRVVSEKDGHGLLSQNWGGRVGIGLTGELQAIVDEFYMYNHAVAASDLMDISEECDLGAGGAIPTKEGSYDGLFPEETSSTTHPPKTSTTRPSTHSKPPTTLSTTTSTQSSSTSTKRPTTPTTRATTTPTTSTTTHKTSTTTPTTSTTTHKTSTTTPTTSATTTKPTIRTTTHPTKKQSTSPTTASTTRRPPSKSSTTPATVFLHEHPHCEQSLFYFNSDLKGGMSSGLFFDMGKTESAADCLKHCCQIDACDVAFLTRDHCYAVDCFNAELCEPVAAPGFVTDKPSLYYVTKNGKSIINQELQKFGERPKTHPPKHLSATTPPTRAPLERTRGPHRPTTPTPYSASTPSSFCTQSMFFYRVGLIGGWEVGRLLEETSVDHMSQCVKRCCEEPACDFAMFRRGQCYTVRCRPGRRCNVDNSGDYQISFVSRLGEFGDSPTTAYPTLPFEEPALPLGHSTSLGRQGEDLSLYLGFDHVIGSVVVDDSGLNNDAKLTKGASIKAHSKHGPGVRLMGGDVSLDGEHFLQKPLEAITIGLWMNLRRIEGVHSMFDTVGSHSFHHKGQYHFEVFDGRIRWFHRDEFAQQVFSVRTTWPLVSPNTWYHVTGTYDSRTHVARIYLNGSPVARGYGAGVLSQDWGARAGFGSHSSLRRLIGSMDEIYIFARALSKREIRKYVKNMEEAELEDVYSPTSSSWDTTISMPSDEASPTSKPSKKRKAAHPTKLTTAVLQTTQHSDTTTKATTKKTTTEATTTPRPTTATTKATTKQTTETTLQNTTAAAKPTTHFTTTTTRTTDKETTVKTTKPTTQPTTKQTTKAIHRVAGTSAGTSFLTHSLTGIRKEICELGNVYRNSDLVGGLGSGKFTDKGKVKNIEECMRLCCQTDKCTVAYLVELSCFAVNCHNKTLCETFRKSPLESSAVIGFVQRYDTQDPTPTTAATTKPILYVRPTGVSTVSISPLFITPPSKASKQPAHRSRQNTVDTCSYSGIHRHVTLKGGLRAGKITRLAEFSNMKECARKCCGIVSCDAALLLKSTCFALDCSDKELCQARPSRLKGFSLMVQYVKRQPIITDNSDDSFANVVYPTESPTSTVSTEPSLEELLGLVKPTQYPATKSQIEALLVPKASPPATNAQQNETCSRGLSVKNVILSGGMAAGQVTQFPHLKQMPLCLEKCCSLAQCHVAYIIHEVCYTVSCFSRDLCRTRPLEGADVTSEIAYVKRDGLTMFSRAEEASVAATSEGLATEASLTSSASQRTLANSTVTSGALNQLCRPQTTLQNVRLLGDFNAGVFNDSGLVSSMEQCSAICCARKSCDLAYMVNQRCYVVKCYSVELCRAVNVPPMAFNPTIAYVMRSYDGTIDNNAAKNAEITGSHVPLTSTITTTHPPEEQSTTKVAPTHAPTTGTKDMKPNRGNHSHPHDHDETKGDNYYHYHHHHHHHHHHPTHEHHVITSSENEACPAETFGCQHYCVRLTNGGYRCMCHRGFKLQRDGRRCEEQEECSDSLHGCEHRCVSIGGGYKCECDSGFLLNVDRKHCDDLNECLLGIHGCSQICHNSPGSYRCSCRKGYRLSSDKMNCQGSTEEGVKKDDTKPLKPGTKSFEIPTMIVRSPKELHLVQGRQAIFHCKARGHPPPHIAWASGTNGDRPIPSDDRFDILPSGALAIRRVNITDQGFYRCVASNPAGSSAMGASLKVQDLDECASSQNYCGQVCVNTPGSYRCECKRGFNLQIDERTCKDVDECTTKAHVCDQRCTNTPGSYMCACRTGYKLINDMRTCIDIDECTNANHDCSQLCNNTAGGYYCACLKGYQLSKDNRTCIDKPTGFNMNNAAAVSAGVGAFVGLVGLCLVMIVGSVLCALRLKRLSQLKNGAEEEGQRKSLFSWLE